MRALVGTGFVLLLIFNRSILKLELHGNEIIGYSFLFPQFVGQAFAIVIVAVAALFERNENDPALGHVLLAVAIPIAEAFHLVPAVQLFGVLLLLIAVDLYLTPRQNRVRRLTIRGILDNGERNRNACLKYAFALNTTLLLALGLIVGFFLKPEWLASSVGNRRFLASLFSSAFVSLFLVAGVFAVAPKDKMIDAADLATTERFAKTYMQTAFDNPPGKFNYAVGITPMSAITDYFITRGALYAPPPEDEGNTEDVFQHRPFSQPSLVGHILTSRNSKWDVPNCRTQFASPSLVVLDGSCTLAALSKSE